MLKSSKNRKIVLGVVGGILVLVMVGLIGGLLMSDDGPSSQPDEHPSSSVGAGGVVPTPDPATRDAYIAALNAIDPDIVHGKPEKAVTRGRDQCNSIQYHSDDQAKLVKLTNIRFTSPRHPRGFGEEKAEQILAAIRQYICPTF